MLYSLGVKWVGGCSKLGDHNPLDETHLDAVRAVIKLRGFHPITSTSGARGSDEVIFDKDKQICFVLLPRT